MNLGGLFGMLSLSFVGDDVIGYEGTYIHITTIPSEARRCCCPLVCASVLWKRTYTSNDDDGVSRCCSSS